MSLDWIAAAAIIAAASFVQGLAGFGIGLVALAFLPYLMTPATAVVLMTLLATVFCCLVFIPLRGAFRVEGVDALLVGTLAGMPLGVWILASVPASVLARLIGAVLIVIVALELAGLNPKRLPGRGWGLLAGVFSGVIGGAVGTPGPPAVVYLTAQGWSARSIKATLQAFLVVNQLIILAGYWWAGLLTTEVWQLGAYFALPAAAGLLAGMRLFDRVD
ncbi:MAG TPA: sulfite exporter TauE/SafE family protein, partial [Methylomirabilota bacterium]